MRISDWSSDVCSSDLEDALLLAREGAQVVLTDVNEEAGRAVAKAIGDAALFIRHDISSEADWKAVIAGTEEKFGGVDILVNNAAILAYGTIETTSLELWPKIQTINSDGYFPGCPSCLEALKKTPNGSPVKLSTNAR